MDENLATDAQSIIHRLEKRLERERKARAEAEAIAELGLRKLYKKQQEIELLCGIATASNEAATFTAALTAALASICAFAAWPVGHVYLPDTVNPDLLIPTDIWHLGGNDVTGFREATSSMILAKGVGLPGRVMASCMAAWVNDVTIDTNFPRSRYAAECGLKAGFAFPVIVKGDVVAILEFFSRESLPIDRDLLDVMAHIGTQLSRVVERERDADRIQYLAYHDTLTGLPNRRLFKDRLEVSLGLAIRRNRQMAVLFLDLDRFKIVNDTLGHKGGDDLLDQVAKRLKDCVREGDTIARWAGDEFVVLLAEIESQLEVGEIADRILDTMRPAFVIDGQELYVTFSIGGTIYPNAAENGEAILRNADIALYSAKQHGRNCYELFTPDMALHSQGSLVLETSLRRALANDEFIVYYQPQVDIKSGKVVGLEALVRWQHPELGTVSPAQFIPLAEETGVIVPLGAWVMETACAQVKRWQDEGQTELRLSVNVSLRQFQHADLLVLVTHVLERTGLKATSLELEITESLAVENLDSILSTMQAIRALGVQFSLDDFGTGYSSLSSLSMLPMDTVKIDKSFVQCMLVDPRTAAVAKSIIQIGRSLGLQVIAEGVELPEQLDFLASENCDTMQGYLFSRPVSAAEIGALLCRQVGDQLLKAA